MASFEFKRNVNRHTHKNAINMDVQHGLVEIGIWSKNSGRRLGTIRTLSPESIPINDKESDWVREYPFITPFDFRFFSYNGRQLPVKGDRDVDMKNIFKKITATESEDLFTIWFNNKYSSEEEYFNEESETEDTFVTIKVLRENPESTAPVWVAEDKDTGTYYTSTQFSRDNILRVNKNRYEDQGFLTGLMEELSRSNPYLRATDFVVNKVAF